MKRQVLFVFLTTVLIENKWFLFLFSIIRNIEWINR
jgi:hypothetical protein